MAAIFQADIWCDDCADCIKEQIATEIWNEGENATLPDGTITRKLWENTICPGLFGLEDLDAYLRDMDERNYDSYDYPKWCDDNEESDTPQHCASGEHCMNYGELPDGFKYGYFFGNELTTEGEEYVKEAVRDGGDIARLLWMPHYDYIYYEECDDSNGYSK